MSTDPTNLAARIVELAEAYDILRTGIPTLVPATYAGRTIYAGYHDPARLAMADRLRGEAGTSTDPATTVARVTQLEAQLAATQKANTRLIDRVVDLEHEVAARRQAGEPIDRLRVEHDPIHCWFELSYAQYLTIPRSVLQSMPQTWQARFVACLEELDATIDWRPPEGRYWVELRDAKGRIAHDPLKDYERGRRRIPHRTEETL